MIIHAEVVGEDDAARHLIEAGNRAKDLRPAARAIRTLLQTGNKRNWATKGALFGDSWPPLAASTVKRWGSGEIGVASGKLKAAIMGGAGSTTSATRTSVKVGVKVPEAHLFAGGRKGGRGGVQPARKIIDATRAQISDANDIIATWITEGHT